MSTSIDTLSTGIEPETRKFLDGVNSSGAPPIYTLSVDEARKVFSKLQSGKVEKPDISIENKTLPVGPSGQVDVRILRPKGITGKLPTVMYFHGAGWVLGDFDTHERLVCELVDGIEAAFVFVNFSRSPEAPYPTAIEEAYAATKYVADNADSLNLDVSRLAIAGDSVGGNMAIAVSLMAKDRGSPAISYQVLFYPVTDASLSTQSYSTFANDHFLTLEAMKWFWENYLPERSKRKEILASPINATREQLEGLPPALIMTAEFDVLRDEGELYAHKLTEAGVEVKAQRMLGTIHDFVMLNAITNTPAPRTAIKLACQVLKDHFVS